MVDDKKTVKTDDSWLDEHNLNEIVDTTNLNILPKYDAIPENDLITTRKVIIESLPIDKHVVKKDKTELDLTFITISDNGIKFSLPFNSKALQRSLISLAIKESKAMNKKDIDFSKILGKMYGLKREQFSVERNGIVFTQSPLKFFMLSK